MQEFEKYLEDTFRNVEQLPANEEKQSKDPTIWSGIHSRIKNIVVHTIRSTEDQICSRKNTYELFGYDFMVDS